MGPPSGHWGTPMGGDPPGQHCQCRASLEREVPHVPHRWEAPRAPLAEDPLRCPAGGGPLGPPPHCPGLTPSACQAVGACTAPLGASPGGIRQRPVPVQLCSHPPARVSHTLTTRPQTHSQHPKAEFEKCFSVPAPAAARPAAASLHKAMLCCPYRAPIPLRFGF